MKDTKHKQIYKELHDAIRSGAYQEGERLPSENQLVHRFGTSRPTVARALLQLQHQGLVERRVGSGTYVKSAKAAGSDLFGLLIPGLGETEIFEPICKEMSRSTEASDHALLWADTTDEIHTKEEQAELLSQHYITRKVSGVFFAPLEFTPNKDLVNQRIATALEKASIPVILLDRDIYEYPRRSHFDLVGIDNRRGGFTVTEHLLKLGCKRIAFLARPGSAPTIAARISGYKDALQSYGLEFKDERVCLGDPADEAFVGRAIKRAKPEAIVCANDDIAGHLMHTLDDLGIKIPTTIRIVGFDDVKYAKLLRVPLTTLHQPCRYIGAAAVRAMLDRILCPDMPGRDILLDFRLLVRQSCGAHLGHPATRKPH